MPSQIITNIKQLVNVREQTHLLRGTELAELPVIENAYLIIEDGVIAEYGEMKNAPLPQLTTHNSQQATILPAWCDSHTHLVFSGSRENEFVDTIKGLSYADIAAKGGGILNSAKKLIDTSEDELFMIALKMFGDAHLQMSESAESHLRAYLSYMFDSKDKYFGNARVIRSIFEEIIRFQNIRLSNLSEDELAKTNQSMIELEDVYSFVPGKDRRDVFNRPRLGFMK